MVLRIIAKPNTSGVGFRENVVLFRSWIRL